MCNLKCTKYYTNKRTKKYTKWYTDWYTKKYTKKYPNWYTRKYIKWYTKKRMQEAGCRCALWVATRLPLVHVTPARGRHHVCKYAEYANR